MGLLLQTPSLTTPPFLPQTLERKNLGPGHSLPLPGWTLPDLSRLFPELCPGTHKLERMQIFTFPLKTREIVIMDVRLVSCQNQLLCL